MGLTVDERPVAPGWHGRAEPRSGTGRGSRDQRHRRRRDRTRLRVGVPGRHVPTGGVDAQRPLALATGGDVGRVVVVPGRRVLRVGRRAHGGRCGRLVPRRTRPDERSGDERVSSGQSVAVVGWFRPVRLRLVTRRDPLERRPRVAAGRELHGRTRIVPPPDRRVVPRPRGLRAAERDPGCAQRARELRHPRRRCRLQRLCVAVPARLRLGRESGAHPRHRPGRLVRLPGAGRIHVAGPGLERRDVRRQQRHTAVPRRVGCLSRGDDRRTGTGTRLRTRRGSPPTGST